MARLGLYCGTFNPIHNGHMLIAECARQQFQLEKVIFVTSAAPPHRNHSLLLPEDRHEMVAAAVADNPFFEASRLELDREGPSYTIDTARQIKQQYGQQTDVFLLIGGDNLKALPSWHQSKELIGTCKLLVAPRLVYETAGTVSAANCPGSASFLKKVEAESYELEGADVSVIDFPASAISSSLIRQRLTQGLSVLYMVPKPVFEILKRAGHYHEGQVGNGRQ